MDGGFDEVPISLEDRHWSIIPYASLVFWGRCRRLSPDLVAWLSMSLSLLSKTIWQHYSYSVLCHRIRTVVERTTVLVWEGQYSAMASYSIAPSSPDIPVESSETMRVQRPSRHRRAP